MQQQVLRVKDEIVFPDTTGKLTIRMQEETGCITLTSI